MVCGGNGVVGHPEVWGSRVVPVGTIVRFASSNAKEKEKKRKEKNVEKKVKEKKVGGKVKQEKPKQGSKAVQHTQNKTEAEEGVLVIGAAEMTNAAARRAVPAGVAATPQAKVEALGGGEDRKGASAASAAAAAAAGHTEPVEKENISPAGSVPPAPMATGGNAASSSVAPEPGTTVSSASLGSGNSQSVSQAIAETPADSGMEAAKDTVSLQRHTFGTTQKPEVSEAAPEDGIELEPQSDVESRTRDASGALDFYKRCNPSLIASAIANISQ